MKSAKGDVHYFEVDAMFDGEPVEVLEKISELDWKDWGERVTTHARRFCAFWSLEMFAEILQKLSVIE